MGSGCLWCAVAGLRRAVPSAHQTEPARVPVLRRALVMLITRLAHPAARIAWLRRKDRDGAVSSARMLAPDAWPCCLAVGGDDEDDDDVSMAGLRLATGAAGLTLALLAVVIGGPPFAVLIGVAPPIGVALPDADLTRVVYGAHRRLSAALPDALDLMAAALIAGHDLDRAVNLAAAHSTQPLSRVLSRVSAQVAIGQSPVAAIEEVGRCTGEPALAAVAAMIARNRTLGLPIAPALRAVADEARSRAHIAVADRAARAGPLAAVVTAGIIAPACVVFLVVTVLGGLTQRGAILGL
jgi:Flp pilus assembly protein TadB